MKLTLDSVCQGYGPHDVLHNISFEANSGELVAILGPNGCGKSTLIKTLCNIMRPRSGTISIDDVDIKDMKRNDLAKKVGYVPQSASERNLSSVYDTVLLGRRPYVNWNYSLSDLEKASHSMIEMDIGDLAEKRVAELSGGQQQRVFIARTLTQDPEVYVFDEPTSSLDLNYQIGVMEIMKGLVRDKGVCAIISLHDLNLALRYADKVIVIKEGHVHSIGRPDEVITEKMIEDVYGVMSRIVDTDLGRFVLPFGMAPTVPDDKE